MKGIRVLFLLAVLLATGALILSSCASAPPAEEPAPPPATPAPQPEPAKVVPPPESERSQALELRGSIEKNGLVAYAEADWQAGEKQLEQGQSLFGKDNEKSRAALLEAIRLYRAVLDAGFPRLTTERQQTAETAKDEADRLKAEVALADKYAPAAALYEQALAAQSAKEYARAIDLFAQATPLFNRLATQAEAKREKARKALQAAYDGIQAAESQEAAAEQVRYAPVEVQ